MNYPCKGNCNSEFPLDDIGDISVNIVTCWYNVISYCKILLIKLQNPKQLQKTRM